MDGGEPREKEGVRYMNLVLGSAMAMDRLVAELG
jgi:hypothetical protein